MGSSSITSIAGSVTVTLVYVYLYVVYRKRYMGLWSVAWFLLLLRYTLFDTKLLPWQSFESGIVAYQCLISLASLLLIAGTYQCIGKNLPRKAICLYCFLVLLNPLLTFSVDSIAVKLFVPIALTCMAGIHIGCLFLQLPKAYGIGKYITGLSFIFWCVSSFILPHALKLDWLAQMSYIFGGVFRLTIALGTLMVYFEKTHADLLQREREYRLLAENAADAIYLYNLQDKHGFKYISPAITQITGYLPQDFYENKRLLYRLIHKQDRIICRVHFRNLTASTAQTLTVRLTRKDGSVIYVEQRISLQHDEAGNIESMQGVIRDVTERRSSESLATKADRTTMLQALAASVTHEIRNVMTTIDGYLHLLTLKTKNAKDLEKYAVMQTAVDHAQHLIQQFLKSASAGAAFEQFALNHFIQSRFLLLEADARRTRSKLHVKLGEIPPVYADKSEILQILINWTRNAAESMVSGGNITVRTALENHHVILSVIDEGTGIPPELLPKLGTPYLTTKKDGTGLGLMACYHLAKRNYATIEVKTSPAGTEFRLCLPVFSDAECAAMLENSEKSDASA